MSGARLAGIWVYPVKGARGFSVERWSLDAFGLAHDRRWAVIDDRSRVLTQRDFPRLALVETELTDDRLRIAATAMPSLDVAVNPCVAEVERVTVTIWDDRCQAEPCAAAADAWWSMYLGAPCRMVRMPEETVRPVESSRAQFASRVAFADAFPLLLLSEGSLAALNERLPAPVPMNRFRPNLVISGVPPHAEDGWDTVRIGAIECVIAKPCERCVVTTIDQATGVAGHEPLRTLSRYRRGDRGVLFGQNVVHRAPGVLRVGDAIDPVLRADDAIQPVLRADGVIQPVLPH